MPPLAPPCLPRSARVLFVALGLLLAAPVAGAQERGLRPGQPIPNMVGRSTFDVYAEVGDAVEYIGVTKPGPGTPGEPGDCVKYQYPSPGTTYADGDKVTVFVSSTVKVPKIEGMDVYSAQEWLAGMCLSVGIASNASGPSDKCDYATCPAPSENGMIKEQCTPAGTEVPAGHVVCVVLVPPMGMGFWKVVALVLAVITIALLVILLRRR